MKNDMLTKVKSALVANIVPIVFIIISLFGIKYSGVQLPIILNDVISRMTRNLFLVLSLLIPVLAGMGLNFGIVLGAMAGQFGLFAISVIGIPGVAGLLAAIAIAVPLAVVLGWMTAQLLNRTKGQEMIAGLILGFFAMGVYQFVFLFFIGGIVPLDSPEIMLSNGIGVRNTIDLKAVKYAFDKIWKVDVFVFLFMVVAVWLAVTLLRVMKQKTVARRDIIHFVAIALTTAFAAYGEFSPAMQMYRVLMQVPMVTAMIIVGLCLFMNFLFKTKLGQNMRAVGHNMEIAEVSGINVNRTRTIATVLSIVFAAIGQIIFLQNLGNISTYNAHENVGMFAAAALLIGGASISKATVPQALVGAFLFHLLFNVSPMAGKNLFGAPEIGEYFRVFIAYGIIAVTLALHAWKKVMADNAKLKETEALEDEADAEAAK